eukprot:gene1366-32730_t
MPRSQYSEGKSLVSGGGCIIVSNLVSSPSLNMAERLPEFDSHKHISLHKMGSDASHVRLMYPFDVEDDDKDVLQRQATRLKKT